MTSGDGRDEAHRALRALREARDQVRAAEARRDGHARMVATAMLNGGEVTPLTLNEYAKLVDAVAWAWLFWQDAYDRWARVSEQPPASS